jgi:5-methylcytosine-specific restriction endonuclease McrA
MKEMAGKSGYCRPCHAEDMRERRRADPERARARDRESYEAKKRDPQFLERKRITSRARSADARRMERYPGASEDQIRALLADPCSYCGGPGGEIDHIEAGGSRGFDNLTAACRSCNAAKGDKSLLLFLAHRNGCFEHRRDTEVAVA